MTANLTLKAVSVADALPSNGVPVLVWFDQGACVGARYGEIWREAQFGEDQLHGVTHWAEIPLRPEDLAAWAD